MANSKFLRKHQVRYKKTGRKSFSCDNCNYTVYSKRHLIRHFNMHDNPKCVHSSGHGSELDTCIPCYVKFESKTVLDEKHGNFSSEIHEFQKCAYKTTIKDDFDDPVKIHSEKVGLCKSSSCRYCDETFKSKLSLDDHVVRKHPNFITTVTRKLHECSECTYKTIIKRNLVNHMSIHLGSVSSSPKPNSCSLCNATFKKKISLDDHMVRSHQNSATSVARKIYECTECIFKTVQKCFLDRHMLTHPEAVQNHKLSQCSHCDEVFKSKISLDDHIVRKHPDFILSITSKLYECTKCIYKTTSKSNFDRHNVLIHPETPANYKFSTCTHCNATFKKKTTLDDHVIKHHPEYITSVSRKIYECTECVYRTVRKNYFEKHKSTHPESTSSFKLSICLHCNATFKNKISLDDHVVRKHPNFIASVARKIYSCTECTYTTILKHRFDRHTSMHPETSSSFKLIKCLHCNVTFKTYSALDDHVVKKHPDFITSVARKIYECTKCTYKTTFKYNLDRHISVHSEINKT